MDETYPATYDVDYPDRKLNRLTTFFRIFTAIPILVVLGSIGGGQYGGGSGDTYAYAGGSALLALPPLLMILFRRKYPRWWFDWNQELLRFTGRVAVYLSLLDDRYPSTDERQSLRLELRYPDVETELQRGMPLVKWLLAIPHYVVLLFLGAFAFVAVVIAWFAILLTGRYPRALFDFVVGVERWWLRVIAYAFVLTTDEYPPFRLSP
jgi:Domain of unknown function (DUF4389)